METVVVFGNGSLEGEKGVYTDMEQWTRIRLELKHEDTSKREVMRREGIHWDTLQKIESNPEPPGYRMAGVRPKFRPVFRPPFTMRKRHSKWEFDRKMIHEKYKSVVEGLKKK